MTEDIAKLVERLPALLLKIGLPISPSWMYMSIRHCQRNMDFEEYMDDDLNVPDRQCGDAIAEAVNALPTLLDTLTRLSARIEELEGTIRPFAAAWEYALTLTRPETATAGDIAELAKRHVDSTCFRRAVAALTPDREKTK